MARAFPTGVFLLLITGILLVHPSLLAAGEPPRTPHWYGGAGWGVTSLDEGGIQDRFEAASGLTATSFTLDDDEDAWRVIGGYQFNRNLALELNYLDLNEFDFNGRAGATTFRGNTDVDGFSLGAVGRTYFSRRFFGLAKAGIFRWESTLQATTSTPSSVGQNDHGGDPTWGLGLGYHLSPRMDLRAEWDRYEIKDEDLSLVSANLIYRFGGAGKQPAQSRQLREKLEQSRREVRQKRERIQSLESRMAEVRKKIDGATVEKTDTKEVVLILPNRVLFPTGQAGITEEGRGSLTEVARTLKDHPDRPLRVEGHTDTVPIQTDRFPSNWELSAARATNVVKFLVQQHGVSPGRIAAVAHGEHQPRVPNTTPENRRMNRRVEIVILPPDHRESSM